MPLIYSMISFFYVSYDCITVTYECDMYELMCDSCNIILTSTPRSKNKKNKIKIKIRWKIK